MAHGDPQIIEEMAQRLVGLDRCNNNNNNNNNSKNNNTNNNNNNFNTNNNSKQNNMARKAKLKNP